MYMYIILTNPKPQFPSKFPPTCHTRCRSSELALPPTWYPSPPSPSAVIRLENLVCTKVSCMQCHCIDSLVMKVCMIDSLSDLCNEPMVHSTHGICKIMTQESKLWEEKKIIRQKKDNYLYRHIYLDPSLPRDPPNL